MISGALGAAAEIQAFLSSHGERYCLILRDTPENFEKLQQLRSKVEQGA